MGAKAALCVALCLVAAHAAQAVLVSRFSPEADTEFGYHPAEWLDLGRADHGEELQVTFALRQRDTAGLLRYFNMVSDPRSTWYGAYLSRDEVTRFTAATTETLEAVYNFVMGALADAGVPVDIAKRSRLSANRDFLHVRLPVHVGETMFGVRLHRFVHSKTAASYLRAREHYSLPIELKDHVDFVAGINRLHHADGSAAVMERLTDAKAPATAALPAGSASIPLAAFGGGDLMVQVLPRCSDGSVTTAFNVCSSTASPIRSLTVTVAPNDASLGDAAVSTFSSTTLAKLCQSCSAFKGDAAYGNAFVRTCGTAATSYGITNVGKVQVCRLPLTRVVTAANSTVSVKTFFADGSNSTGSAGELSTFIEPMVTPESIRSMYLVDATGAGVGSQSVAEFLGQFYSPSDLEAYLSHFHVATTNVTVVGPNDANDAGGEASLDIQVMAGVAAGIPTTFYSTAGRRNNSAPAGPSNQEPFLRWITAIMDEANPPLVHSSSYSDKEVVMPIAFTDRLNVEFQKAGTRGLSLFFATGDDGASGITCRYGNCSIFNPTFPPSSPYVISVGGTQWGRPDRAQGITTPTEVTADSVTGSFITSGGGFSNRYAMPEYQSMAVQNYVASTQMPPASMMYNTSNRAYPDVSAISTNFIIYLNGSQSPIGGTSASTPTTASIFSLLNQGRLQQSMPAFGFVNPLMYVLSNDAIPYFNDIVAGNNKCSAIATNCADYGFFAAPGWDACTGLGSPVFNLLSHATVLSTGNASVSIGGGSFTVESGSLLGPRGMWGPGVLAVAELKGTITGLTVTSGAASLKIYENGVAQPVSQGSINYFDCSPNGSPCYPKDPLSLFLTAPGESSSSFTVRVPFRMPRAQATGQFSLILDGKDQNKNSDFAVTFGYEF